MIRYTDLVNDTICAPVTPAGYSGVAIVRVSGGDCLSILKAFLDPKLEHPFESHRAVLKKIFHPSRGHLMDSALVTFFKQGSSFTGDAVVEIACHGNPHLVSELTSALLEQGCRLAEKGEFSFRAFKNGNIDPFRLKPSISSSTVKTGPVLKLLWVHWVASFPKSYWVLKRDFCAY